jgi:hypothetical protein
MHCCASHLHYADKEAGSNGVGFRHTWGSSRTHAPSEQTHPQSSRFTPRYPSVVLWTPCSGVEWACVRADHQGLEKRHKVQAACEPGGGGCGRVPVHPLQLHTHRTSPAPALWTMLTKTCEPNV